MRVDRWALSYRAVDGHVLKVGEKDGKGVLTDKGVPSCMDYSLTDDADHVWWFEDILHAEHEYRRRKQALEDLANVRRFAMARDETANAGGERRP